MPEERDNGYRCPDNHSRWHYHAHWIVCLIFAGILLAGIYGLALQVVPRLPKFAISNASLTQFNFSHTNTSNNYTLHYNLALNVTIRNSNKRVGIVYRSIEMFDSYLDKRFDFKSLNSTPFYQDHHNSTTSMRVVVQGKQVGFGEHELAEFNSESAAGIYSLRVTFTPWIKFTSVKLFNTRKPLVVCELKVPLIATHQTSAAASGFNTTKCRNLYSKTFRFESTI